ncbi:hypothetical protein PG989_001213 [Apiospora arundinis]
MRLDPDDGGDQFLFSSGDKFCLGNIVSDDVAVMTSPMSQNNIIKALGDMLTNAGPKDLNILSLFIDDTELHILRAFIELKVLPLGVHE